MVAIPTQFGVDIEHKVTVDIPTLIIIASMLGAYLIITKKIKV